VTAQPRARPVSLGVDAVLAFGAGAASFGTVAVALHATDADILAVAIGALSVVSIVAVARSWGVAYSVPVAMAALLAFDWFQFPPTHRWELPRSTDLLDLVVYLGITVLVGELAATAGRRADTSEAARVQLHHEQAALRRVATLVAQGVAPNEVFASVAAEVGRLFEVDGAQVLRCEDEQFTEVAGWTAPERDAGTPAEAASISAPIVVDGHRWGVMLVWSAAGEALAEADEDRLSAFTNLVATAISNTASREELARLAEEQAALRHVATLVARQSPADEVFAAVAEEIGRLLAVEDSAVFRYEDDGTAAVVADWGAGDTPLSVGMRVALDGENIAARVHRTGRAARIDDYAAASGSVAARARAAGVRSAVGSPIVVEGRLWGAVVAASRRAAVMPADTEARIAAFTELVATAIANIEARSELAASRARIVAAADAERRRVVRDLHDGAQQRLVHTVVTLTLASQALDDDDDGAPELVTEALEQAKRATGELRELAHGILPAALARGGLRDGVDALAARMTVLVHSDVSVGRLPRPIEATAYFVVAEALTNVAKHARASEVTVTARETDGELRVEVRDDGVGGANPGGSGLQGLADRVAALDGRLEVESPPDGGTLIAATIPAHRPA
jgi:signal transduction histidine kinase